MGNGGVAGDGFLGGFMGSLSYLLTWAFIFAAAIVAMVALYIYLPLRKQESYRYYAAELSCMTGLGLFLLLQFVLVGSLQPLLTLAFLLLLIPIGAKTLFSSLKDAVRCGADSDSNSGRAVAIVSSSSTDEEDESSVTEDVLLIRLGKDRVRGFSAIRVSPTSAAATFGEPQSCVTMLTALSKFQSGSSGVEWVFKVGVDPSSGGVNYNFIAAASGKVKRRSKGAGVEQNDIVNLVRRATLYLRSALLSVGFTAGDEAPVPGVELLKSVSIGEESHGSGGVIVGIRGLPEKVIAIEDLEGSSYQKQRSMSHSSSSSSPSASLFHPVGRIVRFMVAENIAGSYVVRFKKTKPPEGVTILDSGMVETTNGGGAHSVRGGDGSLLFRLRRSVAGRLRLADGEELAEEVIAGVRRGYWSVESYVAMPEDDGDAVVKVSSTVVSCFSGGVRGVETATLPIQSSSCDCSMVDGFHPLISDAKFRNFTGEMSSDSLASFITLSPPYPMPGSDASLLAEFEIPCGTGNGARNGNVNDNGFLHIGRAYFRGTPVGDVKIPVEDLSMHVVVLGESGFGKTTKVVDWLGQLWDIRPELDWTIIDLKGEYVNQIRAHVGEPIRVLRPSLSTAAIGSGDDESVVDNGVATSTVDRDHPNYDDAVGRVVVAPLRIDLFALGKERKVGNSVERVFSVLKESLSGLFRENVELSPMMERVLRESLRKVYNNKRRSRRSRREGGESCGGGFFDVLFGEIERYVQVYGKGKVDVERSSEALKNRVDRFRRGILGVVLNYQEATMTSGVDAVDAYSGGGDPCSLFCSGKVVVDLSECVKGGCSREDVRLLLNMVMEVIFESAFRRGLVGAPETRHLTIVEEANLLVPDVLHRRTMGDLTAVEDMVLTARGFGEGLILVAQRPTISSFILANAGTKVVFRSPYDSRKVGEFMGLNEAQEEAVKSLRKFEALVTRVQGGPYKVSTAKPKQQPQLGRALPSSEWL